MGCVVALVAIVIIVVHVTRPHTTPSRTTPQHYQGYAETFPVVAGPDAASSTPATVLDASWGMPLKALGELNVVATNTEAVFVVVPSSNAVQTAVVQSEVAAAAATLASRGTKIGMFLLSQDSKDYSSIVGKIGAPSVVAMSKGRGMTGVPDKQVSQETLLKAFDASSRTSSTPPGQTQRNKR
jgi:hypothetical protein